jgi:hypothetical protein
MNVRVLPSDIGLGVLDGREAVLGVPHHVGRKQGKRDQRHHDTTPALERVPRLVADDRMTADAERSVDHRLLGKQAKPDGDAEQNGEGHALPLHQHHPSVKRNRPEQDQRDIGGDQIR